MNFEEALICAMTDQMFIDWAEGTEEPMFPVTEENDKNLALKILRVARNAVAYGYVQGLKVTTV